MEKDSVICPYCDKTQSDDDYQKTWSMRNAEVFLYICDCGKSFNFYLGKNTTWTVPKNKN